jgi:hypothetical protein
MNRRRAVTGVVAVMAASAVVRRSRLARLLVATAIVGAAYRRFSRTQPEWHDVEPAP